MDTPRRPKTATRATKPSQKDIFTTYGLPPSIKSKSQLRYTTPIERGILWYWFSLFIRTRDKDLPCINCGLPKEDRHAGHYIGTGQCGWDELVFNEKNVNSECSSCNQRDKAKLKYEYNLEKKYPGAPQELKNLYHHYRLNGGRNWSRMAYIERINYYRGEVEKFSTPKYK